MSKDEVAIEGWLKEIVPGDSLRKWFSHDPSKWSEFKKRYKEELETKREMVDQLGRQSRHGAVTLVYAANDSHHDNALALKEVIAAG